MISIEVSCVIFQGGSLLIARKRDKGNEFYAIHQETLSFFFVFIVYCALLEKRAVDIYILVVS